jgi:Tol biopolymer transport system component
MPSTEATDFRRKLSKVRVGMAEKELTGLFGQPQFVMNQSAAMGMFGNMIGGVPESLAKRDNWVYKTPFGDFQTVMEGGRVVELLGVKPLLEKLGGPIAESEGARQPTPRRAESRGCKPQKPAGTPALPAKTMTGGGRKKRAIGFLCLAAVCLVVSIAMPESNTLGSKMAVIIVSAIRALAGGGLLIFLIAGLYYLIASFRNSQPVAGEAKPDRMSPSAEQPELHAADHSHTDHKPKKQFDKSAEPLRETLPSMDTMTPEPPPSPKSNRARNFPRNNLIGAIVGGLLLVSVLGFGTWLVTSSHSVRTFLHLSTPEPTAIGGGSGRIAFSADAGGNRDLYTINADGSDLTRLTTNPNWDWSATWSPDGRQIAYLAYPEEGGEAEIYLMNADGSNSRRLTQNQDYEGYPAWSPDGTRIAFVSLRDETDLENCGASEKGCNSNIYTIELSTLTETRLTDSPFIDEGPAWSPDGRQIAFYSSRNDATDIYRMDADGSNVTRLTQGSAYVWRPRWSPEGNRIAYNVYADGMNFIHVMDADGSDDTALANIGNDAYAPAWSPDGRHLAYSSTSGGTTILCIVEINGNNATCMDNDLLNSLEPVWQPLSSTNGILAVNAGKSTSIPSTVLPAVPTATNVPPTATRKPPTNTPKPTTGEIRVKIFRSDTNQTLPGAYLELQDGESLEALSTFNADDQGYVTIKDVKPGSYALEAQAYFPKLDDSPCKPTSSVNLNPDNFMIIVFGADDGGFILTISTFPFSVSAGDRQEMNIDLVCK